MLPIIRCYLFRLLLLMPAAALGHGLQHPADTSGIKKQGLLIQSEGFAAREKYLGQSGPNVWVRNTADGFFTAGIVPIRFKAFYTTEEGSMPRQISSFAVSLDTRRLKQNLNRLQQNQDFIDAAAGHQARQLLKKQLQESATKHGLDSTRNNGSVPSPGQVLQYASEPNVGVAALSTRIAELQQRLNNPDYQEDIIRQKTLLEQTSGDTSLQARLVRAQAQQKLDAHKQAEADYAYCNEARQYLQQFTVNKKVEHLRLQEQYRDSLGASSGWASWLQLVQQFDAGTVNINDHPLAANGLNLNGANVTLKVGKCSFGGFYGQGMQAPYGAGVTPRTCSGLRLGYGQTDKVQADLILLQARDEGKTMTDAGRKQLNNLVFGAKVIYRISRQLKGETGYSRSLTTDENLPQGGNTSWAKLWQADNKDADAAYTRLAWRSRSDRSRVSGMARYTGAAYYSAGNPFLRRNNIRMEGRYEQKLFKNKLNLNNNLRYDIDNPQGHLPGTSRLVNFTSVLSWRITRSWMLSPTYTILDNRFRMAGGESLRTRIHLTGATVSFTRFINERTLVWSVTALRSWSQQPANNEAQTDTLLQSGMSQQTLATDLLLTNVRTLATVNVNATWSKLNQQQLTTMAMRVTYPLLSGRLEAGHGLHFLRDAFAQERYGVSNSLQLQWGKKATVRIAYDTQYIKNLTSDNRQWNHLFWLTISILVF